MPTTKRRRAAVPASVRRDAILDAATRTFADKGFAAAQVADIARLAAIAAGTIYLHFKGKDDLLVSIFDRLYRQAIDEGRVLLSAVSDPVARLRGLAERHLRRLERNRPLAVVCQLELRPAIKLMPAFSGARQREYVGLIRDTIALGQARGDFRTDISPALCARVFIGALDEMATSWILVDRTTSLEADAGPLVDLFLHGAARQPVARTSVIRSPRL